MALQELGKQLQELGKDITLLGISLILLAGIGFRLYGLLAS
jgi:hypothetical protein